LPRRHSYSYWPALKTSLYRDERLKLGANRPARALRAACRSTNSAFAPWPCSRANSAFDSHRHRRSMFYTILEFPRVVADCNWRPSYLVTSCAARRARRPPLRRLSGPRSPLTSLQWPRTDPFTRKARQAKSANDDEKRLRPLATIMTRRPVAGNFNAALLCDRGFGVMRRGGHGGVAAVA
jgi:hypothetical protein